MPHLQFENQAQRSVWEDLHQLNITVRRSQYAPFLELQLTTSSRRQDGGAYCGAAVGGKSIVPKEKLVIYEFA